MLLFQYIYKRGKNPGLDYRFVKPVQDGDPPLENKFEWKLGPWSACSARCGQGTKRGVIERGNTCVFINSHTLSCQLFLCHLVNPSLLSSTPMCSHQLSCALVSQLLFGLIILYSQVLFSTLMCSRVLLLTLLHSYQLLCALINSHAL